MSVLSSSSLVGFLMSFLVIMPSKPLPTLRATKWFFTGMDSIVILQDILPHEAFVAHRAFISGAYWPGPVVRCERFTQISLLGMESLRVCRKLALFCKSHSIHCTGLYCATVRSVVMIDMVIPGHRILETLVEIKTQHLRTSEGVFIIESG